MYYNKGMKKTNVAKLRQKLGDFLKEVGEGEEIELQKRNVPFARIVPFSKMKKNKTQLGVGKGTVAFKGSVVDSPMDKDWEMLK